MITKRKASRTEVEALERRNRKIQRAAEKRQRRALRRAQRENNGS